MAGVVAEVGIEAAVSASSLESVECTAVWAQVFEAGKQAPVLAEGLEEVEVA